MRKKVISAIAGIIGLMAFLGGCKGASLESEEYTDLNSYYGIVNTGGYQGVAVLADGVICRSGIKEGDSCFVAYEVVREHIDKRHYYDMAEGILTYASSGHIYDVNIKEPRNYTCDGQAADYEGEIVILAEDRLYINCDYIKLMNNSVDIKIYEEPCRVVINSEPAVIETNVKKDACVRENAGVTYDIVKDIKKGETFYILEEEGGWTYVTSYDGTIGYIQSDMLGEKSEKQMEYEESWLDTEPYTYMQMEDKICLAWHQMESKEGNNTLKELLNDQGTLNVVSPTWFKLADTEGNITSLASSSYVDTAHDEGLYVWGLINDFDTDEFGELIVNQVLPKTSSRRALIDNLIDEAEQSGLDGLNIDFEMIRKVHVEGYIQFMRELAIACEEAELVLSVDMYTPTESNVYYDRESVGEVVDYVIIMGYDEHWAGCYEAGSVASLPFVTSGIEKTIASVPAERVINAVPFFTRIWYEDSVENAPENAIIVEDNLSGAYALSSKAVGMSRAKNTLVDAGAEIRWLDELGQYYGDFYADGQFVRIWLEDGESLRAKLNVMEANGIAGVACWKLGLESEEAWQVIGEYMSK